jgi:RHS repeat-associated protein
VTTFTEYDPMGRLQLVTFDDLSTLQYAYDAVGRLTAITDSISGTVSYTYNDYGCGSCSGSGLDRIAQEVSPLGTVDYTYDALGRRESMTLAGSPVVGYTYDDADRLTMIDRVVGGNAKEYNFEYDPAGRRTSRNVFLYKNKGKNKYLSATYVYDIADNLTSLLLQSADTAVEDYTMAYNENGLRKSVEMTGTLPQTNALLSATFDDANEMLTHDDLDLTYDANGNLTYIFDNATQEGTTYTWDARNRLVGIDSFSIDATFSYDALNRRTERVVNSVTTQYAYDSLNVIKETKSPGQSTKYVYSLNIDEPLALERADGTVRYYLIDALGSTVALANGDTGNVTTTYSYDAFGNDTINGSDENPFQYTSRENDGTGLHYYRARYYSPTLRRFISEDPIGLAAGLNFYAYAQNNPINFIDPRGLAGVAIDFGGAYATGWGGPVNSNTPIQQGGGAGTGVYLGATGAPGDGEVGGFTYQSLMNNSGDTPGAAIGAGVNLTFYFTDANKFFPGKMNYKTWNFFGASGTIYSDPCSGKTTGASFGILGKGTGWQWGATGVSNGVQGALQ